MELMATLHMSEAELTGDVHAALGKVQAGAEIIIEQDHRPVAVIHSPFETHSPVKGRLISECIALSEARGAATVPDEGFAEDVAEGIRERSQPWNPPSWE